MRTIMEDLEQMNLSDKDKADAIGEIMAMDGDEFDDESPEGVIDEAKRGVLKKRRSTSGERAQWRKTAKRRKAKTKALHKKGAWKSLERKREKIRARRKGKSAGARKFFSTGLRMSGIDYSEYGDPILESIGSLIEASESGGGRKEDYTEAFNLIADIGELLILRYHEAGLQEMVDDSAELAIDAEMMVEELGEMDDVLTEDEDLSLEEVLSDAVNAVMVCMESYSRMMEKKASSDDEYEDEDEEDWDEDEEDEEEYEDEEEDEDEDE